MHNGAHVCIQAFTHALLYVCNCMLAGMYACKQICIDVCFEMSMLLCMRVHMLPMCGCVFHVSMYVRTYVCMYVCMYVCRYVGM